MWESIKSLFSAKTIPFLISQGVGPKLLPVGTLVLGLILGFIWAYAIAPVVPIGAGPVNMSDSWKREYVKQVAWQLQAEGNSQAAQSNAQKQLDALGNADAVLDEMLRTETDANLQQMLQNIKAQGLARPNPEQLAKVTPGFLNGNIMPFLCILGLAIIVGGAVI